MGQLCLHCWFVMDVAQLFKKAAKNPYQAAVTFTWNRGRAEEDRRWVRLPVYFYQLWKN